jgi:hypothetical protein
MWISGLLGLLRSIGADEQKSPEVQPEETTVPEAHGIRNVGAWCGSSALLKPDTTIAFAKSVKLTRLDVIVNDHAAAREEIRFDTYDKKRVIALCTKAKVAGLDVHLMSWIMPHESYIIESARQLIPLFQECQASSIQWDAEEPWTLARRPMNYTQAASLVREKFKDITLGVNGIGYTPVEKFGPLAAVCDTVLPQCYATSTSGVRPEDVVPRFTQRWEKVFRKKPTEIGLAAYRQTGIHNHTIESAMKTVLASAQALSIHTVIYWSLGHIQKSLRVQNVIKSILSR